MSFRPWLGTMPPIDAAIQLGLGVAGAVIGQPYNVFRLEAGVTSGSIFEGPPVLENYPILFRKVGKAKIEDVTFDLQIFEGKCDNRVILPGDVFVELGASEPYSDNDQMVFAQRRPIGRNYFVRCESSVSITRPQPEGGQSGQQQLSGVSTAPGYMGVWKAGEWPLVLNYGSYSFTNVPGSIPAAIPAGLVQLNRIRDASEPKIPVALYREHFVIFFPLLPGVQPRELDRVNFPNEDRYQLASIYTSEQTGIQGYICICEKLGA